MTTIPFLSLDLAVAPNPPSLISDLKLVTIPIDAYTCFELWKPTEHGKLMIEEALFLKEDYSRLEEICSKLMWLLGAKPIRGSTLCSQDLIHDWYSFIKLLRQAGKHFDAIVVDYSPPRVCSVTTEDSKLQAWTMHPSSWTVSFLEFTSTGQSYQANTLPLSLSIVCGQPSTRTVEATPVGMKVL